MSQKCVTSLSFSQETPKLPEVPMKGSTQCLNEAPRGIKGMVEGRRQSPGESNDGVKGMIEIE